MLFFSSVRMLNLLNRMEKATVKLTLLNQWLEQFFNFIQIHWCGCYEANKRKTGGQCDTKPTKQIWLEKTRYKMHLVGGKTTTAKHIDELTFWWSAYASACIVNKQKANCESNQKCALCAVTLFSILIIQNTRIAYSTFACECVNNGATVVFFPLFVLVHIIHAVWRCFGQTVG